VGWLKFLDFLAHRSRKFKNSLGETMNISPSRRPADRDDRQPVRILLIGDRRAVKSTIDQLCVLGFCDQADWSAIMPQPQQLDYISVMTKWRSF
jgi:hypothetical protein